MNRALAALVVAVDAVTTIGVKPGFVVLVSAKTTDPVGTSVAPASGVTVAVKVTSWPYVDPAGWEDVRATVTPSCAAVSTT